MSRTATQVWERLRKMHFRGDNPLLLSMVDYAVFLEEVNKQREERGKDEFTQNDVLMYKGRQVFSNPVDVVSTLQDSDTKSDGLSEKKEELVSEPLEKSNPDSPSDTIRMTHNVDELIPPLRLRR